ncbi:MAG: hypothetical protein IKM99_05635 [Bacteroidales bacterium]|nr:hypothetical protein [Bacteroidales bacterium]
MTKHFTFIQKMVLAFAGITIVFALSSCGDKNANRFKEAAMQLDNTTLTIDDYDYWPEGGIRNIGGHLASLISLNELQKMLPCPLYVSGPHHDGQWDLYSDEFGHYNPQAIQYLADLAKKVVADKKFVAASKPLVDKYLFEQMHIMMVLHDLMYDESVFDKEGREYMFADMIENYGYTDGLFYFLEEIDLYDETGIYNYFNYEFLYFWARRWSDGTIDQFYDGLSTIYKAYYPDYNFVAEDYYFPYDYEEEEMGETSYYYELEPDEPVQANERIKENDAVNMFREAASNLDKTYHVLGNEFDYWPECAIRVTGSHLFSLISLKTLNRMLPCDLYVSGPHHYNRWELEVPYDFGRYNPEAIQYLGNLAKKVVADKKFIEKTKPLVDQYLKRQMFIMKGLYDGLNDKNVCNDKEAVLQSLMETRGHAYGTIANDFLGELIDTLEDDSYVYGNTGEMFLYWWARRDADGTMEQFHDVLETVYNAYYAE